MSNQQIIYLADDHNLVAKGIASIIQNIPNIERVEIFTNGKELFDACLIKLPTLVFLDIEMPIWDGRTTLVALKDRFPTLRCLMLSMLNEKSMIEDCLKKGASGYLNKDCTDVELQEAIFSTDEYYFSKDALKSMSGITKKIIEKEYQLTEPLTDRELEILSLLCEGLSPKEIADKIYLSPRTVETHKKNIMFKMDVNSVGKLISVALKNNLI
ncbi:MAG: response regulator transcription factor [Chitinophagaceae bacterium]|jgi:DNA-binding NarL/FixJ family response regulator|nr:response regulator transcription factor [Chitinophagaceae bacterium]